LIEPLILVRAVHFAATLLAAGTVAFLVLVAEPSARALRGRLVALTGAALILAVFSGAAWLVLLAADILGAPVAEVCRSGDVWSVATGTRFGEIWTVRLALAVLLAALLPWPRIWTVQLASAALFAGLPAAVGHAGAGLGTAGGVSLVADAGHLLAASVWLGGLPALALTLRDASRTDPSATIPVVARFSRLGVICVAVLLGTGLINSWALLNSPSDLIDTTYGRLLLLKGGLFLAMLAFAGFNRWRFTPRLPAPGARRALLRNSLLEIVLGLGVLLVVGVLGTTPPGGHRHEAAGGAPDGAFVHLHSAAVMADVSLAADGPRATIRLTREDGTEFPAQAVRIVLEPRENGAAVSAMAARGPEGTWEVGDLARLSPGIWTVKIVIGQTIGGEIVLDGPIVIAP